MDCFSRAPGVLAGIQFFRVQPGALQLISIMMSAGIQLAEDSSI